MHEIEGQMKDKAQPGLLVIYYEYSRLCWELVIQASSYNSGYTALTGDGIISEFSYLPIKDVKALIFP
jgi:hypothetical protein